ncbi:hypothetical protein [Thalassotalea aquiviva]|uniref:hypothetical protein n=1 Tax=Thalassotalea aquiviva TaxID=3242415 RepID=UPI00352BAB71
MLSERQTNGVLLAVSIYLLSACSSNDPYPITDSIVNIKHHQILDATSSQTNEGIVTGLNGSYGEQVIKNYVKSADSDLQEATTGIDN